MSDITQTIRRQAQENRKRAEELKTEIDELDKLMNELQIEKTEKPAKQSAAIQHELERADRLWGI